MEALRSVLNDDSFKIMSSEAFEARKAAQILLDWCLDAANNNCFTTFVLKLSEDLKQAMSSCKKKSCNREKLFSVALFREISRGLGKFFGLR